MGYRTNVIIEIEGNEELILYRHNFGGPMTTGADLITVGDKMPGDFFGDYASVPEHARAAAAAMTFAHEGRYEMTHCLHGDIENLWRIRITAKGVEYAWCPVPMGESPDRSKLRPCSRARLVQLVNADRRDYNRRRAEHVAEYGEDCDSMKYWNGEFEMIS